MSRRACSRNTPRFGRGHGHDLAPFDIYHQVRGLRWPVVNGKETRWRYREGLDPYVKAGSGLAVLRQPGQAGAVIMARCPTSRRPKSPDEEFDLWLVTGRVLEHWHSGSMTLRVPELYRAFPGAVLFMHPDDAQGARSAARRRRCASISRRGEIRTPRRDARAATSMPRGRRLRALVRREPADQQGDARRHRPDLASRPTSRNARSRSWRSERERQRRLIAMR